MRKRFGFVSAILGLALLTACGGAGGTDTTTAQTETSQTSGGTDTTTAQTGSSETTAGGGELEKTEITVVWDAPEFDSVTDAKWVLLLGEAGVTVETVEFDAAPDAVRAMASGDADILNTSPLPIMQFIQESGGGLEVITAELLNTDYVLLTTPDVTSIDDLAGKQIGISEPGDISDTLTRLVLENAGFDLGSVEIVQIGGTSQRIAALTAGEIAAGAAHAADGLAAVEAAGLTALVQYWDYIDSYAQRYMVVTPEWSVENPNLAQLVVDSLIEANRWAAENKEEYIALSQEVVAEIPDEIRNSVYDFFIEANFFGVNGGLESIQDTVDVERSLGNLTEDLPDQSEWVNSSFVESYLERNGEQ